MVLQLKILNQQYIFCNEIFDCVAIGGLCCDKFGQPHIFGAHIYTSILKYQMENIVNEISKLELTPKIAIYSPREDTSKWEFGKKVIENSFLSTNTILRERKNQAEMIIGIEGIILNDKFYKF